MTTLASLRRCLLLGALTLVAAAQAQAAELQVDHAWSRSTVAGQQAGGAFLTVKNKGAAADRLLGASSPAADHVELHTMWMEGDVMKMRETDAVPVPAGESVSLAPGKLHLMLIGLKSPLQAGTTYPLTLKFEKAGELKVDVKVEGPTPMPHDMKDMKH